MVSNRTHIARDQPRQAGRIHDGTTRDVAIDCRVCNEYSVSRRIATSQHGDGASFRTGLRDTVPDKTYRIRNDATVGSIDGATPAPRTVAIEASALKPCQAAAFECDCSSPAFRG